jgi:glucans biosynthesis protein
MTFRRRPVLRGIGAALAAASLGRVGAAEAQGPAVLRLGPAEPFSFEGLVERARALAGRPYAPPPRPAPEVVARIDYDAHGRLRFDNDYALFRDGPGAYPVSFVFMGGFFPKTVRMHAVEGGAAREVLYSPNYFAIPP